MRPLDLGLLLPTIGVPSNAGYDTWEDYRRVAVWAEEMGLDKVWVPDELLWRFPPEYAPMGTWECVAVTAAVATATTRIKVGTWVLSALHRNPGLTVKAAETIDDISGGRFVFGFGAGHSGMQGRAFGYPEDKVVGRYEEALEVVVALLREGKADFAGEFHSASEQENTPRGPQRGSMPLMLAGHGPRTIGLAARHGDIWSGYATESSHPDAFAGMLEQVGRACVDQDRDPDSLGKSIGVIFEPSGAGVAEAVGLGTPLSGSAAETAEIVHRFAEMGVTMLEFIMQPFDQETLERFAEVIDLLDS